MDWQPVFTSAPCAWIPRRLACSFSAGVLATSLLAAGALASELLYATEGNRLHRVDLGTLDSGSPSSEILIERASGGDGAGTHDSGSASRSRDINGTVCRLPDGSGRFVAGEDTGQPETPPGWGVFSHDGVQIGKLTATYRAELGDPYGCVFDSEGRLFTTEVGNVGFGSPRGQLILWFPPLDRFPGPRGAYPATAAVSDHYCKLAVDIGTAGGVAMDRAGRVYVASASRGAIYRFSPPFPTSSDAAGGCGARGPLGSPMATRVQRETFVRGLYTFSGLAFGADGHLYAASVFTGEIAVYDTDGRLVRKVLDPPGWFPPFDTGTPQGIAFDSEGTLYYADLDLVWSSGGIGPGPDGKVWRIRFGPDGQPLHPEVLLDGLAFPDAVAVHPGER